MKKIISKTWDHRKSEEDLYENWENSGYFRPEFKSEETTQSDTDNKNSLKANKNPFVVSMPPPNVTGKLHVGHSLFISLEDLMTRYHRLQGEPTLWLPGTDHAGIATQNVVEKALLKKKIKRREMGREKFVEKVWEWKEEYGDIITTQLRRMGASCDWSRERFTLDTGLSKAVNHAFKHLHEKGLIYQDLKTINWCPRCHSAISDDEVEYKKVVGKFYWLKYGPFTLATSRPETKLGDTAVAVSPKDKRYKEMVGKKYMIPGVLGDFEIEVVEDMAVDPEFGTGAVKVTPAHSLIDFEIAQRHDIPLKQVIDENGRMMENTGKYAGMKTKEAREEIVKDMQKLGLIEKIDENYEHNIGVCYRCGGVIEPIPSKQWFVKMKPLAEKAKKAVESGEIEIVPKRFEKVYFHWLDNIRDWCISRQLWWGHRIPVWYRQESNSKPQTLNSKQIQNNNDQNTKQFGELENSNLDIVSDLETRDSDLSQSDDIYVGEKSPGEGWKQDEDVLDTWFSSALWPFSTLNWPNIDDEDYKKFYPTTVMETGYDILFFWVARMIMMGLELTGEVPFKTVYLHGLVRDEQNRKMSKSLGNVMDPLDAIEKYGTDALRMSLIVGSTPGQDTALGESKIKGYRNFSNKIWNASRFVALRVSEGDLQSGKIGEKKINDLNIDQKLLTKADKEILEKHKETIEKVTEHIDKFRFSLAGETIYHYFWDEFCDKYIEQAKEQLENLKSQTLNSKQFQNNNDQNTKQFGKLKNSNLDNISDLEIRNSDFSVSKNTKKILVKILSETLIMLHPFVPFVTEAVWQDLREIYGDLDESIMISTWPKK